MPFENIRMNETATRNLAARMGRWSAQHRKKAILGWLAFVILAVVIGGAVGTNTLADEEQGVGESKQADQIVADAFPEESADESVLVQSTNGVRAGDPQFRAAVNEAIARDLAARRASSRSRAPTRRTGRSPRTAARR